MGLAPYGEPKYVDIILKNIIHIKNDGSFRLNQEYFDYMVGLKMINKILRDFWCKEKKLQKENLNQFHMDIASSIQVVLESIALKITRSLGKNIILKIYVYLEEWL